jgi:hypothetical protein
MYGQTDVLACRQDFYNTNPSSDNINKVQAQIDTVKDVMIENIDRVLERGERIELLVDKTDRLNQQAFKFEKSVSFRIFNGVPCLVLMSWFCFVPRSRAH